MSFFDTMLSNLGQKLLPTPSQQQAGMAPPPQATSLPGEDELALADLARALGRADYWPQRQAAIRMYKAREMSKGFHYIPYGDEFRGFPEVPSNPSMGPRFAEGGQGDSTTFTFNFIQAYEKSILSVLGGRVPGVRFYPRDPNNQDDIATASAKNDIWEHFCRVNRIAVHQMMMLKYGWTDGVCGIHFSNATDADRFGTHKEPLIEQVPVTIPGVPPHHQCPQCGAQEPPDAIECSQCAQGGTGQWFGPQTFVPGEPDQIQMVPQQTGWQDVPNKEDLMTVVGGLELQMIPLDARDQSELLALAWKTELDLAYVKAMHPDRADKIRAGTAPTDLDQQSRTDRLRSKSRTSGGQATGPYVSSYLDEDSRVTYTRMWMKPAAFWKIKNDGIRNRLMAEYPKGVRVAMAGPDICSVEAARLDDDWSIWFPFPGDSCVREGMGDILMDVQDALNDLYNLALDQLRHSLPITFIDEKLVNMEAIEQQREQGGMLWPVNRIDQQALGGNFYTTQPAQVSPQVTEMISQLAGFVSQFLSGANPALLGQGSSDLKTASGFKMALGQSLGRMSIPWKALKEGMVQIADKATASFVRNNQENGAVIFKFDSGSPVAKQIAAEDLRGQTVAYSSSDEEYPQNPADVRDVLLGWINSPNMQLQQASLDQDNFDFLRTYLGVAGFSMPGEKQRKKQLREIQELLRAEPIPPPIDPMTGGPMIDPMTGMPMQPQPSVPIDPIFDDNPAEYRTVQQWMWTDEARSQQITNPAGYENVRLHGQAHFQQTQMMQMGAPPPGMGPMQPSPLDGQPSLALPPTPGLGDPPPELQEPAGPPAGPPAGLIA